LSPLFIHEGSHPLNQPSRQHSTNTDAKHRLQNRAAHDGVNDHEYDHIAHANGVSHTPVKWHARLKNKAVQLNLLDHNEMLSNGLKGIGLLACGVATGMQGFLLQNIVGALLSFLGLGGALMMAYQVLHPMLPVVTEQTVHLLMDAKRLGVPLDAIEVYLNKAIQQQSHPLPKRLRQYAWLAVCGRGKGSFALGVAAFGLAIYDTPHVLLNIMNTVQGTVFLGHGAWRVAQDVRAYNTHHHPLLLAAQVAKDLQPYLEKQKTAQRVIQKTTPIIIQTMEYAPTATNNSAISNDMATLIKGFASNVYGG
jgi:hypothetical protein